ncbi:unnamed protein product [Brassica oleracea]
MDLEEMRCVQATGDLAETKRRQRTKREDERDSELRCQM